VASGSPFPSSVVLWTRIAPDPLDGGGAGRDPITVRWEVAHDEGFARIARSGMAVAVAENAHAVHVVADGLQPGRWYFYRFIALGESSPVGRTRTAPARTARVTSLRVAFGSCQHFEFGFYGAHRHIAAEAPDLMIFLGDYIYEGPGRPGRVRRHSGAECRSLAQYRNRYALYRTDPELQRLHAAVPWLVTFDDHEVDNDYAGGHPFTPEPGFRRRRAAAYRAFFEHMPLRPVARPQGGAMRLHAHFDFGRLARVHVLDGRQHRSPQACKPASRVGAECRGRTRSDRTMLGTEQERWLREGVAATADRWNLIAQQTLMARALRLRRGEPEFNTHTWDGYPAARRRLLRAIDEVGARSCVVLSGDAHRCVVSDLRVDFSRPRSPIVATELCGPSLTSPGASARQTAELQRANAHIHFAESESRGYFIVELEPQVCRARFRALADVADPSTAIATLARFEIRAQRPGALDLGGNVSSTAG
jgi:alkaline phosphatase D